LPAADLALFAVDFNADALLGDAGRGRFGIFWEHGNRGSTLTLAFVLRQGSWSDREKSRN
jgi:hypothetical protein